MSHKKVLSTVLIGFSAAVLPGTGFAAQSIYSSTAQDTYQAYPTASSQALQGASGNDGATGAGTGGSSAGTLYSSSAYPSAQGHFLQAPSGTQRSQGGYAAVPAGTSNATVPARSQSASASSGSYAAVYPAVYPVQGQPQAGTYAGGSAPVAAQRASTSLSAPRYIAPVDSPSTYSDAPVSSAYPKAVPYGTAPQAPVAQASPSPMVAPANYDDLPTYTYSKRTDPSRPPYKTPIANDPSVSGDSAEVGLGTLRGYEIGADVTRYSYREFDPSGAEFIRLTGPTFGITGRGTQGFGSRWFIAEDLRITYGSHDYTGGDQDLRTGAVIPSTKSGDSDYMFDVRVTGGYDFLIPDAFGGSVDMGVSPYGGFGFRYLYNDGTGADSNNVPGYKRYSHYLYLPLGVNPRFRLSKFGRLSVNLEYDLFLTGWQVSSLGDATPGLSDLTNTQSSGYGLRGSVMYEEQHWGFGPFLEFWDISQSSTDCASGFCGVEPHNQTVEVGIKGHYRF